MKKLTTVLSALLLASFTVGGASAENDTSNVNIQNATNFTISAIYYRRTGESKGPNRLSNGDVLTKGQDQAVGLSDDSPSAPRCSKMSIDIVFKDYKKKPGWDDINVCKLAWVQIKYTKKGFTLGKGYQANYVGEKP